MARTATTSRRNAVADDDDDDGGGQRGGRGGGRDRDQDTDRGRGNDRGRGTSNTKSGGGKSGGGFSWASKDATQGGLISSGTWRVLKSLFTEYDYGGTVRKNLPTVLLWEMEPVDGGEKVEETWTIGKDFAPSKDGEEPEPLNGQPGFPRNCKIMDLIVSLEENGAEDLVQKGLASAYEGLVVEVERKLRPERQDRDNDRGRNRGRDGGKEKFPETVLIVSRVVAMPGEDAPDGKTRGASAAGGGRGTAREDTRGKGRGRGNDDDDEEAPRTTKGGSAKGGGRGRAAEPEVSEHHEPAKEALIEALEKAGGKIKIAELDKLISAQLKGNKAKAEILDYAAADTFLDLEEGWIINGKMIELEDVDDDAEPEPAPVRGRR